MRLLFKHERAVFTKGQFAFDTHAPVILLATISLLILAFVYYIYIHPRARLSPKTLTSLVVLRILFFAFFIFLLLRPVMIVSSVVPRSTDVAVLVDDSQSMLLADEQEEEAASQTRLEAVKNKLFSETSPIWKSLDQKFQAKLFGFSEESSELTASDALTATGARTDIATALESTVKRSTGRPLSAIVLVTDGAHNGRLNLEEQLRQLRSRNVPVFTVGVGSPNLVKDVELMRVNMPRRSLVGSAVHAETLIRTNGYSSGNLLLSLREDGRTIKTRELKLDVNSEVQSVDVDFTPSGAGMRRYTFALTPLEGELTLANNAQEALVEVSEGPVKVLYIEGEPRWEYGKLRTSLMRNEKNVSLISFLRSGENKFYRQGIENEGDLAKGFPVSQDELFAYHGLILGCVEAGFFSTDQLKNIEAFVARRGGGLLALGGRRAFSGGQFGGTPLADLLPVSLTNSAATSARSSTDDQPIFKAQLTSRGRTHPILRFQDEDALNEKTWSELPLLTVPQVLGGVKPGASVLLEGRRTTSEKSSGSLVPLLVEQRYGRGLSLALTASDTWRWQMKVDSKRNLHETFWRQMLRYLTNQAPKQVEIAAEQAVYSLGDPVRIVADVRDTKFLPLKDVVVKARISSASGGLSEVPLAFTSRDGLDIFEGEFTPTEIGQYHLELASDRPDARVTATAQSDFLMTEPTREFFDARQDVSLLKRIAEETGGKYYPLADAGSLVDDLTYRESANSERAVKELWDMPFNFIVLIALVSAEWALRKRSGLA